MTLEKNTAKVAPDSAGNMMPLRINLNDHKTKSRNHLELSRLMKDAVSLEESECRQAILRLNTIPDAVIITTPDGAIIDLNASASMMFKQPVKDVLRRNIKDYLPGLSSDELKRILPALLKGCPIILEGVFEPATGQAMPTDVSVSLCGHDNQELCFILRNDKHHQQTEEALKRIHGRMAKAERLETAGMVAGQIAHDFNNLLTPLLAYPSLIHRELPDDSPALEYLKVIEKTAEDMTHMTQQLLALSRRGNIGNEVFNINDLVNHVLFLLSTNSMPNAIDFELELADDLLPIRGSSDQMSRVLHNLFQNAMDAMKARGGVLHIKTKNIYLESPVGNYESVEPGEYVWMTIADTGAGIPADIRGNIFDPFFTTKRSDKKRGSGLGLSIVTGIVGDHQGYIDVESQEGEGTTFLLYFPVCRDAEAETVIEECVHGNGEKILVLDDDAEQLEIITNLCKALNYDVISLFSGNEALEALRANPQLCSLAILDMRLEQQAQDGCDLWIAMKEICPNMKSLLVSGSNFPQTRVEKAQHHGAGTYIKKPLTLKKLGNAIQEALKQAPSTPLTTTISDSVVKTQVVDQESAPVATTQSDKASSPLRSRVMLVEDEERIRSVFSIVINEELPHVALDEAENGEECLEKFKQTPCDVVVMDLYMPIKDGRQTFIELRDYCSDHQIPMPAVIFCTGFAVPEFLKKIVSDDNEPHVLLLKPVRNADLVDAIRERLPHP